MTLLLACARPRVDVSIVRTAAEAVADWDAELGLASTHRLAPLVYWRLKDTAPDVVPPAVLAAFAAAFHSTVRSNLVMAAELGRVTAWLEAASVPALTFKGPALATLLYPNLGLRQCSDLDLLVPASKRSAAVEVLTSRGCQPTGTSGAERLRGNIEASFVTPNGCLLDLHWDVSPRYFLTFDCRSAWNRARTINVAGIAIRTFGAEDMFAYLALHGARHCWESLAWISDIAHFLATEPLGWDCLLAKSRQRRAITVAVRLACDLFGEPVPAALRPDRVADELAAEIRSLVLSSEAGINGTLQGAHLHIKFASQWNDKLRYLWCRMFEPNQTDNEFVPLPPMLRPVLFAVRPLRVAAKCGSLAARRFMS